MPIRPALLAALLALALPACSSKPPESDTAEVTPDPAVVKPATPPVTAPAPTPEAKPAPKE